MIRTATPRRCASRSAPPTTAAVSSSKWKSYCARSSERRAAPRNSATSCAISDACWPPSVKVRMRMEELIERLRRARIGATFNFYRDGEGADARCERLLTYLRSREEARLLLVGEAPGYRGARVSGVPFTSERQLSGAGPAEATATIVHRVLGELGLADRVLLWNAVPTHPHRAREPASNRAPTRAEVDASRPFLEAHADGRRTIAVGRIAHAVLGGVYVRHPSHGGAERFRAALASLSLQSAAGVPTACLLSA